MKHISTRLIPQVAAVLIILMTTVTATGVALASSGVTLMTPPIDHEDLVVNGTEVGNFPVYDGRNQLMVSWTQYWPLYWPTYPNPQHTDKAYRVSIWQNVTPLAAVPTWVEIHISHHWIDDANPTRFTFDAFLDTEQLCQTCPSMVVIQAEQILPERDANGNYTYQLVTMSNPSGVPAIQKSSLFLLHHDVRWPEVKPERCILPPALQKFCGLFS